MGKSLDDLYRSPRDLALWQTAQQDLMRGRAERSAGSYRDLLKRFPDLAELWFELGFAEGRRLDFTAAGQACARAVELASKRASFLILAGQQYHWLRDLDAARTCFEQAARAEPESVHAQLTLADWYEREHRLEDAWRCVDAALALKPQDATVLCVKALLLHRQRSNGEAESLLRDLVARPSNDTNARYTSRHQLAMVLDETGQYDEALKWLGEAKAVLRTTADIAKLEQEYDRGTARRRELLAALTPEMIQRWRKEGPAEKLGCRLAFLGGHPRSGTTLLEQILGAHPAIMSFDEPIAFTEEVVEKLAPLNATVKLSVKNLNNLSVPQRVDFERRYWRSLMRGVPSDQGAELVLDKNPSPTASLHLWLRLFPDSKVVIALRDPRDVIVSCYFQNLRLNATAANFLSLERTVRHYTDLMDVWLRLRELGGFDWIETRYEDVVGGLEAEGRRVTEFLGLSWHPQQAAFHEASEKKFVFSPTYNAVKQPIYQRAIGRWKHYEAALAPLQAKLGRYVQAFGYAP